MADILRHYGGDPPEGYGSRWRPMRCCFHPDRNASASYNEELDSFACLACEAKGNAVTLLMRVEGLSAREADARATEITGRAGEAPAQTMRSRSGKAYVPPRLRRK